MTADQPIPQETATLARCPACKGWGFAIVRTPDHSKPMPCHICGGKGGLAAIPHLARPAGQDALNSEAKSTQNLNRVASEGFDLARPAKDVTTLAPIESHPSMPSRAYIPLPGGWEVQTKGAGSSFRIATPEGQQRNIEERPHLFGLLERMARDIHAAYSALAAERDEARWESGQAKVAIVKEAEARIAAEAERDALAARLREVEGALERIDRWELPPTGKTWDDGEPMSYFSVFGWGGERDFMRGVARSALDAIEIEPAEKEPQP